ncbi:hypothetical protein KQH93_00700 [Coprococcus comes]|nr:hypothetical protein [Coprococcus comes]
MSQATALGARMCRGTFFLTNIRQALDEDMKEIKAYVIRQGKAEEISLYVADMTPDERKIVKAGCLINYNRARKNQ